MNILQKKDNVYIDTIFTALPLARVNFYRVLQNKQKQNKPK